MRYLELIQRLDELKIKDCDLEDCEITANRIKNISFLIIKNKEGKVVECIILSDRRFEAPQCYCEDGCNDSL